MSDFNALRQFRLISINVASYHFNPGLFSTLITVALLYTMVSLGFWQLDRAEFKDALQQKIEERKNLAAVDLNDLPESNASRRYYPVKFYGEFDTQHHFLLDNKIFKGQVGYHVFTPLKINEDKIILVNRGFIKQGESRDNLPDIETPDGRILIQGLLDLAPSRALVLAENVQETTHWPILLQYIDLNEINQMLGYQLYDMVLWLDQHQAGSLEYDLPVLNLNSAKNNGYAFQWFALSLALLLIYIIVNTKRKNKIQTSGLINE
jgi:surfeit locus 1 family protein